VSSMYLAALFVLLTVATAQIVQCHTQGDPHIKTRDGNNYDNRAQGEFLFYDNKKDLRCEVRQKLFRYWGIPINSRIACQFGSQALFEMGSELVNNVAKQTVYLNGLKLTGPINLKIGSWVAAGNAAGQVTFTKGTTTVLLNQGFNAEANWVNLFINAPKAEIVGDGACVKTYPVVEGKSLFQHGTARTFLKIDVQPATQANIDKAKALCKAQNFAKNEDYNDCVTDLSYNSDPQYAASLKRFENAEKLTKAQVEMNELKAQVAAQNEVNQCVQKCYCKGNAPAALVPVLDFTEDVLLDQE